MSPGEFYSAVYNKAIELGANDVQARLAASQASEETGFGKSMVGNNAFGIKAGSTYTGPSVTASTEEEYNGNTVRENANFRAYDDFTESVKDYLGVIQSNFPDAWSAPTFSDAVKGLNSGVYGKYATRAAYGQHIKAIDNKYGALQYAQEPDNVPLPYSPSAYADLTGLPDDVIAVADPNFKQVDPALAYASNPSNVPTPEAKPDLPAGGLLTAFQPNQTDSSPFGSLFAPKDEPAAQPAELTDLQDRMPNEWGVINGVGPVYTPTVETWSDMAAAKPVQAPMDSVTASSLLGTTPALSAEAKANPMMSLAASGFLGTTPGLDAGARVSGLPEVASVSSRMGIAEPGFDQSRFDGNAVSVASDFDPGRFASPPSIAFDQDRFGLPSIDVATNTASFMDQPTPVAAPADIAGFADAYSAQRGPTQGINSAEMQTRQGMAEIGLQKALQDKQLASFPSLDVPASASIGGVPALDAQATASIPAAAQQTTAIDPTQTGGIAPNFNQALNPTTPALMTAPVGLSDYQMAEVAQAKQIPGVFAAQPAAVDNFISTPTIEDTQVADQQSVVDQNATIPGPATDAIISQQPQISVPATTTAVQSTPAKTTQNKGLLSGLMSKETVAGGALGGLALGPLGGLLGALAGQQVARNGGLSSLFSGGSFSAPTTQMAGGINNIASIYGGLQAPGTFAVANNGTQITAQPGGYTTTTNRFGVTESVGPDGKIASYFGGNAAPADPDAETNSGGFFGGLFS